MTYSIAKAAQATLEAEWRAAGKALQGYPRNAVGLTPDAVKFSPEYRAAKAAYDAAFARLRAFNITFTKTYAAELRAERHASRRA